MFGIFYTIINNIIIAWNFSFRMSSYLSFFASLLMSLILSLGAADCTFSLSLAADLARRLSRTCLSLSVRSSYSVFVSRLRTEITVPLVFPFGTAGHWHFSFWVWFKIKNTCLDFLNIWQIVYCCVFTKKTQFEIARKVQLICVSGLFILARKLLRTLIWRVFTKKTLPISGFLFIINFEEWDFPATALVWVWISCTHSCLNCLSRCVRMV